MKKHYLLLVKLVLFSILTYAQVKNSFSELVPLSETELQKLASIPEYQYFSGDQTIVLPYSIDNTTQPFFRPLFNQSGLECGQAASIGLNFTYEMDWARNLPANIAQNQYATHFTYNFINGGSDAGVSYFESWEIVKRCGTPTVTDYGGLATGGASRWMTGYDKYYNAMHNRISDVYSISAGDETGLTTLKNWIYNHSNTSDVGGLANIYIQYKTPDAQLAAGTPMAGKWVITTWGGSPNHAVTLVGFNDSIRFDYNNDGQYTNNIDINGDGIVNMKDWEIGGFKLANTYGGINNWGDQGFSYVMYKTFADNLGSGGIWNHAAHIIKVKQDVTPKLTYKITLKHTSRNKLKIIAGVSQNPLATEPDATLNLPVFDLQGGDRYMLGGTNEVDKTIEFGIDVTPLLSELTPGQQAKFFLVISETDPLATATGEIVSFALIDYNAATTIIPCSNSNVQIIENGLTVLTISFAPNHNPPLINNTSLPEAKIYEAYSQQMNATGGVPSYRWKFLFDYNETPSNSAFPAVTAQQLSLNSTSSGFAEVDLPFEFPFYGKKYSKLYAHVDGYLMFKPDLMPWTFIIYEKTYFKNTPNIAPYMSKPLTLFPSEGDGIWYEGNTDYAIFRWKSGMFGSGPSTDLNFAVKIFPDGKIEFYYGNIISNDWVKWNAGISNGDGTNYHFCAITDSLAQPAPNSRFTFNTLPFPSEMTLSDEGQFSGTPATPYINMPVKFLVEDNNNMYNAKTLNFSTKGITIEYLINSGGDTIVEYGETVKLTAKLTNIGTTVLHNVNLKLSIPDPYIVLVDSTESIGMLNPGQTVTFTDALTFIVSDAIPDRYEISTLSLAIATEDTFTRTLPLTAYSANLKITALSIQDGNDNILMPGESGTLHITIKNHGGSVASNINTFLTDIDPLISITQGSAFIASLPGNDSQNIDLQVSIAPGCPLGHIALSALQFEADKNYSAADSVYFTVGIVAENFETGNLLKYPWQSGGNAAWAVTNSLPFEGTFCAVSPAIGDNQQSSMFVVMNVLCASEISFYRKISSEANYDFLTFTIDGIEQAKWSGEVPWSKVTYQVAEGTHTFSWRYNKDVNTVAGSDKAWVDLIVWPPYAELLLVANAGPDGFVCSPSAYSLQATAINSEILFWTTSGDGSFSNLNSATALYYPGISDLYNGSVLITLHVANQTAPSLTDQLTLAVYQLPDAFAGNDAAMCAETDFTVTGTSASGQPVLWSTTGDGVFTNNSVLCTYYSPGPADIATGEVILVLTVFGSPECGNDVDSLILTIHPATYSDAGSDQTILYGTSTQLNGQAIGGTGNLSINWEPADQLVYAGILNPFTIDLTGSVEFTLHVTDPVTQCSSADAILVNVYGSPLSINVSATPEQICRGDYSQLQALAIGGSGNYTYLWSSVPAGFTSTAPDPMVNPLTNTLFTVQVSDGINTLPASITVSVDTSVFTPSRPVGPSSVNIFLTPETSYSTDLIINVGEYLWTVSPQEAGNISQASSVCLVTWNPLFNGTADLSVAMINACGIGSYSDALSISASPFTGLPEEIKTSELLIWPNPANESIGIKSNLQGRCCVTLTNAQGKIVYKSDYILANESFSLNLDGLKAGIYLFVIENDNSRQMQRIVISR